LTFWPRRSSTKSEFEIAEGMFYAPSRVLSRASKQESALRLRTNAASADKRAAARLTLA
jgi:hypothetical protein